MRSIILAISFIITLSLCAQTSQLSGLLLNEGVKSADFLSQLEKDIYAELNFARTNPAGFCDKLKEYKKFYNGNIIEIPGKIPMMTTEGLSAINEAISFLQKQKPIEPLKISKGMSLAARDHVNDTGKKGLLGHSGSNGSQMTDRINKYGKWNITCGENIGYGYDTAFEILMQLIVDDGVKGRGHRKNIYEEKFKVVGLSFGGHSKYNFMCVMDYAGEYAEQK